MIAFLRGRVVRRLEQTLVVECGGVGYEIHLPEFVRDALRGTAQVPGETVEFHISYHVSANQPRPLLVGFLREIEQEFFELFITVDGLGPTKAMKAIIHPVEIIADAIERKDIAFLRRLPGIGERTAGKIVATLHGKMAKYALLRTEAPQVPVEDHADFREEVIGVLTGQLGHRTAEARRMVERALERNPAIASAEQLFQEVYRAERGAPV
ncbi:MAG TPA: Holliday junction branch migration protein RuvA [bacterium]|nr:Holliday junction branch migration protein RuvA [bacterium]